MENLIESLLTIDGAKYVSIYFFQLLILSSFLIILFLKKEIDIYIKIIGGLSVFVVAILANSEVVYFLSLLIGGLIIASEQFIKFIFAVWRTHPEKIQETIKAFELATPEQVEEKRNLEIESIAPGSGKNSNTIKSEYIEVESLVHSAIEKECGKLYKREVIIRSKATNLIVDGAIINYQNPLRVFTEEEMKERSELGLKKVIEIKYFRSKSSIERQVESLVQRLFFHNLIVFFEVVIVVRNLKKEDGLIIQNELINKYRSYNQFNFHILSYENKELLPLTSEFPPKAFNILR